MKKDNLFLTRLVNLSIFLILEGLALFMVSRNSLIQKSGIIKGVHSINATVDQSISNVSDYFDLKQVNLTLSEENVQLREENHRLLEYIKNNESIPVDSLLLGYSKYTYIPARVISNQTNKQHNVIIIDKGHKDGIREDMGVITAKGVIGYVLATGENYSIICSLLDTDNMLSATITSSNTFGTLQWNGKSTKRAILKDIPIHTDIIEGDTVTTSGYSMTYPPNLPIATINGKSKSNGINYELSVDLIEDFNSIHTVYAVCFKDKEEIQTLLNNSVRK